MLSTYTGTFCGKHLNVFFFLYFYNGFLMGLSYLQNKHIKYLRDTIILLLSKYSLHNSFKFLKCISGYLVLQVTLSESYGMLYGMPVGVFLLLCTVQTGNGLICGSDWKQNGPGHAKMCLMPHANNRGADQPAHTRSLISTFVVRSYAQSNQHLCCSLLR